MSEHLPAVGAQHPARLAQIEKRLARAEAKLNRWPEYLLAAVVLLLVVLSAFLHVLLRPQGMIAGNDLLLYYFWEYFTREQWAAGQLPLWNPYILSGYPSVGLPQMMIFHPVAAILRLLPLHYALGVGFALHLWWMALGVYSLMRWNGLGRPGAYLAAVAFTFSGYVVPRIDAGHLDMLYSVAWLPWAVMVWQRMLHTRSWRMAVLGGAILGVQFLAGNTVTFTLTLLLLGFVTLHWAVNRPRERRWRGLLAGAGLGGVAGAVGAGGFAFQLWPTVDLIGQSTHATIPLRSCGLPFALDWPDLVSLGLASTPFDPFLPWERNIYFGALALILALIGLTQPAAPRVRQWKRILVTAIVVGLILGFNPALPFLPGERHLLPEVSPFRVPARFLWWVALAGAGLAGIGFDAVLNGMRPRWPLWAALALAGLALPADWQHVTAPYSPLSSSSLSIRTFYAAAVSAPRHLASALVLWLLMRGLPRRAAAVAVLGLLYADLWIFGHPYIHWRPGATMGLIAGQRPVEPSAARVVTYPYMFSDGSVYSHTANAQGYASIVLDTYAEVVEGAGRREVCNASPEHVNLAATDTHLLRLLSVKYVESFTGPLETSLKPAADGSHIYESESYWPRAVWVGRVLPAASYQAAAARVRQSDFDPTQAALIEAGESPMGASYTEAGQAGAAQIVAYRPLEVVVEVEAPQAGMLVLNDVWYPGWRGTVNGAPAPVYRANGAFRAVPVPAGRSTVALTFQSDPLRIGGVISIATWMTVLSAFCVQAVRRRRR